MALFTGVSKTDDGRISNITNPSSAQDVVTKAYGDSTYGGSTSSFAPLVYSSYPQSSSIVFASNSPALLIEPVIIATSSSTANPWLDYNAATGTFTTKFAGNAEIIFRARVLMQTLSDPNFADGFSLTFTLVVNSAKIVNAALGAYAINYKNPSLLSGTIGIQELIPPLEVRYDFSIGDTFRIESFWTSVNAGMLPSQGIQLDGFNSGGFIKPSGGADYTTENDWSRCIEVRTFVLSP